MRKVVAIAVFALVMLGAAGAGTKVQTSPQNGPVPVCDPQTGKCG